MSSNYEDRSRGYNGDDDMDRGRSMGRGGRRMHRRRGAGAVEPPVRATGVDPRDPRLSSQHDHRRVSAAGRGGRNPQRPAPSPPLRSSRRGPLARLDQPGRPGAATGCHAAPAGGVRE